MSAHPMGVTEADAKRAAIAKLGLVLDADDQQAPTPSLDELAAIVDEVDQHPYRWALKWFRLTQFVKVQDARIATLESRTAELSEWLTNLSGRV